MEEYITAISTVGFPIVACCAMYYLTVNILQKLTTAIQNLADKLEK